MNDHDVFGLRTTLAGDVLLLEATPASLVCQRVSFDTLKSLRPVHRSPADIFGFEVL